MGTDPDWHVISVNGSAGHDEVDVYRVDVVRRDE